MVFYDAYWVEMMEWFFNVAGRFLLLVTPHFGGFKAVGLSRCTSGIMGSWSDLGRCY